MLKKHKTDFASNETRLPWLLTPYTTSSLCLMFAQSFLVYKVLWQTKLIYSDPYDHLVQQEEKVPVYPFYGWGNWHSKKPSTIKLGRWGSELEPKSSTSWVSFPTLWNVRALSHYLAVFDLIRQNVDHGLATSMGSKKVQFVNCL